MGRTRGGNPGKGKPAKMGNKSSKSDQVKSPKPQKKGIKMVSTPSSERPSMVPQSDEIAFADEDAHPLPGFSRTAGSRGGAKGHPFSNAAAAWLKSGKVLETELLKQYRWRLSIGEVKCEAFEIERNTQAGKGRPTRIVIVPGNPGVCAYYVRTARELYVKLGGKVSVSAVSLSGFPTDPLDARLVSLPEEAVHLHELLRAMHERHPEEELVLVGHSIGAWMCTELLKGDKELPVTGCAMVFPFVSVGRDKMRRQNWMDVRSWPYLLRPLLTTAMATMGSMGLLLSVMATWQQKLLLKVLGSGASKDDLCREVTLEYIGSKPHILRSMFFLGKTEMCLLPRPEAKNASFCDVEMASLEGIQDKLHWLYTTGDNWAPLEQATDVRFSLPRSSVDVIEELSHAFCMSSEHDSRVAEWVCGLPCLKRFAK